MNEVERLTYERDEKMREASLELMKLQEIQGVPYLSTMSYREEYKTKYEWLFVWTGKKWDILIFIVILIAVTLLMHSIIYSDGEALPYSIWIYPISYVALTLAWVREAWKIKKLPVKGENTERDQRAIFSKKVDELKEIEERLKKAELREQQEKQAMSEDRKEPAEDGSSED